MVGVLFLIFSLSWNGKEIPTLYIYGREYASLKKIADIFDGRYIWIDERKKAILKIGDKKYIFTADNSTVVVEDTGIHLPLEIYWDKKDGLYIPVSCFYYVFKGKIEKKIPVIEKIWIDSSEFALFVMLNEDTDFRINSPSYKLHKILISAKTKVKKVKPLKDIKSIEITALPENTIIEIKLKKSYKIEASKNKRLLKFSFKKEVHKKKFLVILDPGHGGKDPGAIGPRGTKEKTITLDIAKRVKKYLEKEGYKVLMTRTKDKYVSLRERARFANKNQGDIFVSIHCNAAPYVKGANGLETYFLAEAKTTWARAVAMRENASLKYDESEKIKTDIDLILTDLAQNEFLVESSRLAELIQENTAKITGLRNRGLNQAGFYVLKWCFMPSVLVETAFISNKREERLLRDASFREKLAKGIAQGIIKFLKEYERKLAKK